MFVLINRDEMELVAKHPNCMVLFSLGVINCPECQETIKFEEGMFKDFVDSELTMLYISITNESPRDEWVREDYEYLLLHLINECKENILDAKEVFDQAEYCVTWDIQGYCSFVKGKREPSHEEGLWENLTVDFKTETADILLAEKKAIEFKKPLQFSFK